MADFINGLFGVPKAATARPGDDDFADFAGPPDPVPTQITPVAGMPGGLNAALPTPVPFTKWYRVWERTSPSDFKQEGIILPFILLVIVIHIWGRRTNNKKAKSTITVIAPALYREFATVGYKLRRHMLPDAVQSEGVVDPIDLLREKTAQEFQSYATGRQNVAYADLKISLYKRYNPLTWFMEWLVGMFFESMKLQPEKIETVVYPFDGQEKTMIPVSNESQQTELEARAKGNNSSYDGFVWAIVHKDFMKELRTERYDISLTTVKDNAKLPNWATVMSESAEVTDLLLTKELVAAVEKTGESLFTNLIITDQPEEKPIKLDDTVPVKRLTLSLRLPFGTSVGAFAPCLDLYSYFLRLTDQLVAQAHFRPEVLRKIRATRDEEIRRLKKFDDEEKAEERKLETDKKKKAERDAKLKVLSADEQRKFLEKEREREQRKNTKKMSKKA